jgi:Flp pilus assembly pilin Flp
MKNYGHNIVKLLQEEEGVTAIEYAVLLTLLVVIWLSAMATLGVGTEFRP